MFLRELLIKTAYVGLKHVNKNGFVMAGHNGPWQDIDTPTRNSANWLKLFCYAYNITNDIKFYNTIIKITNYLLSKECRPYNKAFYCRKTNKKSKSNGLIGQAWVLEALIMANEIIGDDNLKKEIIKTYLYHKFDNNLGLWYEIDLDGKPIRIMDTFNQQLWFAAIGSLIMNYDNEIKFQVMTFINNIDKIITIYPNGLINHLINSNQSLLKKSNSYIYKIINKENYYLSIGYHSFNLYGFCILKKSLGNISFFNSRKFEKIKKFTFSENYYVKVINNEFGFGYNITGIEISLFFQEFSKDNNEFLSLIYKWLNRQFTNNYDFKKNLLINNSSDKNTLSARLYEATRLNNYNI